jgi:hypothetical protein
MTSTTEQPETAPGPTTEPKPSKKANVGKRARHVASTNVRSGTNGNPVEGGRDSGAL